MRIATKRLCTKNQLGMWKHKRNFNTKNQRMNCMQNLDATNVKILFILIL